MPFNIEPLSYQHIMEGFDCGEASVNNYLRDFALRNHQNRLSRVYVAVEPGNPQVKGFFTLSNAQVQYNLIPGMTTPRYPVPVTLIGQFGRDESAEEQRLGAFLMANALKLALQGASIIGSHGVIVDAINEDVANFYIHYGFVEIERRNTLIRLFKSFGDVELDLQLARI